MNLTDGVAETTIACTGSETPGLTPHAQAEPGWYPVWLVDGDDARWSSWGWTDDGEWWLEAEPETGPTGPRLDVTVSELGRHQMIELCPESARALIAMCQQWLASLGDTPEPEVPGVIHDAEPLAQRLVHTGHQRAELRGEPYYYSPKWAAWFKGVRR